VLRLYIVDVIIVMEFSALEYVLIHLGRLDGNNKLKFIVIQLGVQRTRLECIDVFGFSL
jgi:hypothetical protein